MAYEYERDEWRAAVRATSGAELEHNRDSSRAALGLIGERSDALEDLPCDDPDEAA